MSQHLGVGPARRDVLPKQLAVDIDRGIYVRHDGVGLRAEPAAPHLVAHDRPVVVNMTIETEPAPAAQRRKGPLIAAAVLAGLGALAAVYGVTGLTRNPGDPACRSARDLARRIEPLVRGEVAAVRPAADAHKLPVLAFQDAAGQPKSLADWQGPPVRVNPWAPLGIP